MKVTVPTRLLLDAVGHAAAVATAKSPKPLLECALLEADATTGFRIEATDLDVGVRIRLDDAEVERPGVLAIQAGRLHAVIREVGDERTTLDGDGANLVVNTAGSRFELRGEDPVDRVALPFFPEEAGASVPGAVLRDMIRRTAFATAKEAGRYALHGVLFRLEGQTLELVATDGRRLARAVQSLEEPGGASLKVIIGPKALSLLDRVMGDEPRDVAIGVEERQVLFRTGNALLVSRLIDGSFPAYEDVIPKTAQKFFEVGVGEFAAALRRASLLASRDSLSVQFEVAPQTLTIRSRAVEVGEARVALPIVYDGPEETLGFNPTFLTEALKVMNGADPVRFAFQNGKSPGKLTDREDYVYVVMPIAID
jgi:DNA polymerase-3 subunit beta